MRVLVSGLINMETTAAVRGFPIPYYPVDYPFFGINTTVSGVGFNLAKVLRTLGNEVRLLSMTGDDFAASYVREELARLDISTEYIRPVLRQTPCSVVLYDPSGVRQIYTDLKDIQETPYPFTPQMLEDVDIVAACNINFSRPLLRLAKAAGKIVATDVHVLSDIYDEYNRDYIENADILFLSDELVGEDYRVFLWQLIHSCSCKIIVLGRGSKGAAMYLREKNEIVEMPAVSAGPVVNTVGAGDALFSAFLHFYAKGYSPEDALWRAQAFAAHKITANGAAEGFVSEDRIEKWAAAEE